MTRLSDLGEFGLISRIGKAFRGRSRRAPLGIGDDAAALFVSAGRTLLATTDLLLEGVHFDLATTDLRSLGWKSAAVNLSDIAAMGGIPRFSLTALGIPKGISVAQIDDFYRGFRALLRRHRVDLVGGDTCGSDTDLMISVTVLGEVERTRMLTRAGAKPGDRIFVTGTLGDSAAGLELLRTGPRGRKPAAGRRGTASRGGDTAVRNLIRRHLMPVPRVEIGRRLALSGCVTSMIDVSDGLSSDLGHICEQSGVGAEISAERVPVSRSLRAAAHQLASAPLEYALHGGEDYELLFTARPAMAGRLRALGISAREIGVVLRGRRIVLCRDGARVPLVSSGYEHLV